MTSSAKRPRDYAVAPRVFGRTPNIDWHEATLDIVELMAVKIQHQQAWMIRDAIYRQFPDRQGTRRYAEPAGRDYDQLNRTLRGEITIKINDLAAARRVFRNHINLNIPILGPTTSRPASPAGTDLVACPSPMRRADYSPTLRRWSDRAPRRRSGTIRCGRTR